MSEPSEIRVTTASDWDRINEHTDSFSHGTVREIRFVGGRHVREDAVLAEQGFPSVAVLVQFQDPLGGALMLFSGVREISFDLDAEVTPGVAEVYESALTPDVNRTWRFEFLEITVTASECRFIPAPEALGDHATLDDVMRQLPELWP